MPSVEFESRLLRRAVENQTKVLSEINDTLVELVRAMKKADEPALYTLCKTCVKAQCIVGDDTVQTLGCKCCQVDHHGDAI